MKIAILGGSFNPPHLGHISVAKQVKEFLKMDQIWLMPCYAHPFNRKLSAAKDRFMMVKKLEEENIIASDYEIKQKKISFTIDTLRNLEKEYPDNIFYWISGSDQLKSFKKYKDWQDLIKNHNLIIFPREINMNQLEVYTKKMLNLKIIPSNIILINSKDLMQSNTSSTIVRKRVKQEKPIDLLVRHEVKNYIEEKRLYK